ncbi:MAG: IclR family transcriptional regulator C-terminal domain-containing protein, partial [Pseudomonadota bacterium]|nr:IclR family transcriptional regulator C-terminal domain-containing protein [Pseudomonadota bacterium]
ELPPLTDKTITDETALRKEIQRSKRRGYTVDNEEFEIDLFCIAAPILDRDGNTIAALSISSHSPDHLGKYKNRRLRALRDTCEEISITLYGS